MLVVKVHMEHQLPHFLEEDGMVEVILPIVEVRAEVLLMSVLAVLISKLV